jgi:Na+/H+-dicarboxylate symporter
VIRILAGFLLGSLIGVVLWGLAPAEKGVTPGWAVWVEPFGSIFVNMLKMIVFPVIFFSLIDGAASLPIRRFGRIGVKVIGWYLLTSLFAACIGVVLALAINPGAGTSPEQWESLAPVSPAKSAEIAEAAPTAGQAFRNLLLSMFENPFAALASGDFLPIIVFAIVFGLAIRVMIESPKNDEQESSLESLLRIVRAIRDATFKLVDWILEYAPIGVLALSITNFGLYGPTIYGPYIAVALGVIIAILVMITVVYSILMFAVTRRNPLWVLRRIQEAMIMAFMTRSSAATLPVSLKVAEEDLRVRNELASFSLPLGATVNMDGVCVHLPMFAVLAANLYGLDLGGVALLALVMTTVLASIGAGGVPSGSVFLLFIILETMGLGADKVGLIVGLAMGINPILDMFETMNNVTGDLVCTFVVANNENLIESGEREAMSVSDGM